MSIAWLFSCKHEYTHRPASAPPFSSSAQRSALRHFSYDLCPGCKHNQQLNPIFAALTHKHRMELLTLHLSHHASLVRTYSSLDPASDIFKTEQERLEEEIKTCRSAIVKSLTNRMTLSQEEHLSVLRGKVYRAIRDAKESLDVLRATREFVVAIRSEKMSGGEGHANDKGMVVLEEVYKALGWIEKVLSV